MGLRPRKLSDTATPTAMPPRRMPTILRRVPPLPHRMPTPRRMSPPCCMLPLHRMPLLRWCASLAARVAEDHDGNHQERTKLCRLGNAVISTRRAPRAARRNQCRCMCHSNRSPFTAVNRRHSPPPPRCNWLCASVRKFCWAMVLGCTRLIECSGYFFLVQLTLCTLYNLTKNTIVNVPTKGQLNSEWIYEVIVSPKMPTKHLKDFCPGSLLEGRAEILQFFSEFNWPLCKV